MWCLRRNNAGSLIALIVNVPRALQGQKKSQNVSLSVLAAEDVHRACDSLTAILFLLMSWAGDEPLACAHHDSHEAGAAATAAG